MNRMLKLLVVLLLCSGSAIYAQTSDPPAPGWVAFQPTKDDLWCANYSKEAWRVTLNSDNSSILVSKFEDNRRHVIKVRDGRLVGEDNGEWGGSLVWISKDGRRRKWLSDENVHGFVKTSAGVLVIVGLAHLSLNHGAVLQYVDGPGRKKRVKEFVDLGWAPRAFMLESPDSVIVLTRDGFVRVHASGRVESIFRRVYGLLHPNSFTLSPNGVFHVGMRHFITRLTPSAGTYKEEWFVTASCSQFTLQEYDCVCSAASP
jgi:hypothetical protein